MLSFSRKNLGDSWFYEFECSNTVLLDDTLKLVENKNWMKNKNNNTSEDTNFYDEQLFNWFYECITVAKKDIGIPITIDLVITQCWANKTTRMQQHHLHNHSNSFMSGIFYLSDNHAGGETLFFCKNTWFELYKWLDFENKPTQISTSYIPKKGNLLLFPSHIPHRVSPVKDNNTRYTLAFNTFFSGTLGNSDMLNKLDIKLEK